MYNIFIFLLFKNWIPKGCYVLMKTNKVFIFLLYTCVCVSYVYIEFISSLVFSFYFLLTHVKLSQLCVIIWCFFFIWCYILVLLYVDDIWLLNLSKKEIFILVEEAINRTFLITSLHSEKNSGALKYFGLFESLIVKKKYRFFSWYPSQTQNLGEKNLMNLFERQFCFN